MNEAYLEKPEPEVVPPADTVIATAGVREVASAQGDMLESLGVRLDDEEDLEVQVGDKVTVAYVGENRERMVTIGTRTDKSKGEIDYRTPLADAILGLQAGKITALNQPNRPAVQLEDCQDRARKAGGISGPRRSAAHTSPPPRLVFAHEFPVRGSFSLPPGGSGS